MEKTRKLFVYLILIVLIAPLTGASHRADVLKSKKAFLGCPMTVDQTSLHFGYRGDANEQFISVTNSTAWGGWTSASWIRIDGYPTISAGGNHVISVTLGVPPAGSGQAHPVCGTVYTGTISLYGCSGNLVIPVTYHNCPCC